MAYQPFLCGEEKRKEREEWWLNPLIGHSRFYWIKAAWHSGLHPAKVLVWMLRYWIKLNKSIFSGSFPGKCAPTPNPISRRTSLPHAGPGLKRQNAIQGQSKGRRRRRPWKPYARQTFVCPCERTTAESRIRPLTPK